MDFGSLTISDGGKPLRRVAEVEPRMLGWNVAQSDLIHIPEHWLAYPEPEAYIHYLLALLYTGFFVVSCIGNGLVIWIFSSAKSLRTPSNIFVVNLAICDFMLMGKIPFFIYNSLNREFAMEHIGCKIFAFVGSLAGIGAGMTNACIAYDRYNTIVKPFDGKLTRSKALFMTTCIWTYTLPWGILPLLEIWGRFVPEGFLTLCSFDYLRNTYENHLFVAVLFVFSYVIPISLIIYYYSGIVSHVISHEKALKKQAKQMNVKSLRANQNQESTSVEIRIAKAAITVCFLFVASWTPYAVLALMGSFGNQKLLTPGVTMIPACACKLVACVDPYVYAISHPRYRVELQKRLPWLAIKEAVNESQSTTTETSIAPPPPAAATTPTTPTA